MREYEINTLLRRGFQYTHKRQLDQLIRRQTDWSMSELSRVHKHRQDLIMAKRGLHRRNGDPSSSHEQFIQTSLILDGHHDHRASCLAWSHDMRDDHLHFFGQQTIEERYGRSYARDIRSLSRNLQWSKLAFRDEVAASDKRIRSGGHRTMRVKLLDRVHNDGHPLRITSEKRRRKSGMKLWQNYYSILPIAQELGYLEELFLWLSNRQLKRLRFSARDLDQLVMRPLDDP